LRVGGSGQTDEMLADVLIDVVGDGIRVSVTEHAAAIAQQMAVHGALLVVVVILGSRGFRHHDSQYAGVSRWAIGRRFGCSIIERFFVDYGVV